jgi:peptidyl-prolyl cis-trans isomerase B (cyclophilin B)
MKRAYRQGAGVTVVVALAAGALWVVNRQPARDESRVAGGDYLATITTDFGEITIRLLSSKAPNTVENFRRLVQEKFYDGLSFYEISPDAQLIAAGNPPAGREPDWFMPAEESDLEFERGSVGLFDPEGEHQGGTCRFMIALSRRPGLSQMVTLFGKVVGGMDVVERIAKVETTGPEDKPPFVPLDRVTIHRITVTEAP